MVALPSLSAEGRALVEAFRRAFHALSEHTSATERELIAASIAGQMRSAHPMAVPPPVTAVKVPLGHEGAFYGITCIGDGVVLVVSEASGRDAATPPLSIAAAEELARDVIAVARSVVR